ncbi:hypothetical protein LIPSTDRAFT_68916 [Lipomyces starkeyi NRRL Y-11557]|uniref:FAR1 domain-containing protein n=1 Tax=Lipomyces starkeyi NRRL Y-11557 TaxID=675824 RepID=A0A1E3QAS8_LIPST|nr:hypothetical protein LIPSTDRAFT_68916 [Lipomyces starkeyi NRRL Y-11557]
MDPATTVSSTLAVNAPALYVGMELESAARAREFVNAYAIRHNFAVKNGDVYNKDKSLLLLCKCAKLPSTRRLQPTKGATDDEGLNRQKEFRSMLCDCPWMVRFKKQLNDTWIVTQLVDHHENHQLQGINPLAYPENRSLTPEARETMLDLVRHSNASYTSIASVINTTYGLSLLGRDVYNRSYDYTQKHGTLSKIL